ncbi:hypothetical protein J2Z48_000971 [Croceifilum oryzae]|uniref:Uncharacterized protein n=1 Tax=Croceifilum oryzae TaxID=1553429 RepID=A0AAJ1TE35_9BACL|nr:hypothetical protein [Croceifilum oryzae]
MFSRGSKPVTKSVTTGEVRRTTNDGLGPAPIVTARAAAW